MADRSWTRAAISELKQDREISASLRGHSLRFQATWGLFSPRGIDEGTQLLLDHVKVEEADRILDLGCGYGVLGITLARCAPQGRAVLVDKDFVAIEYSRRNAALNKLDNVSAVLSNGLSHLQDESFQLAVSNLPAKSGKELYYIMFQDVYDQLTIGGRFYIVTITGLRRFVKRAFEDVFGNYQKIKQGQTYTVAMATRMPSSG